MNSRTHQLIEAFIDHQLNEAELKEFKAMIETSSETAQALSDALHMHGMTTALKHQDYEALTHQVETAIQDLSPQSFEQEIIQTINTYSPPKKRKITPVWTLACAAQILILIGLYFLLAPPPSFSIAKVADVHGGVFLIRNEAKLNLGTSTTILSEDQIIVPQDGYIAIRYTDQSEIILRDQSYIKLVENRGAKQIHLYAGILRGDIQKQPTHKAMQIITEDSIATVLGTQFEINSSNVSTLLEVSQGNVRIEQPASDAIEVKANTFAISKQKEGISIHEAGTPLFRSELITAATPGQSVDIEVDIQGAEKLYLVTGNGNDNNRFDHVVWLNPELTGAEVSDLTQHTPTLKKSGWAPTRINRDLFGGPIRVNGQEYPKGISTHATSVIAYDLPPECQTFRCRAALLDSGTEQPDSVSSVHFEIYTQLPEKKIQKLKIREKFY